MNYNVLVINTFIEAAEESLRSDEEYNNVLNALYKERQRFMDAGVHTEAIEGILYEKWWRILKYTLEHSEEIMMTNDIGME